MKASAQSQVELKQSEAYKALQVQIQQTTAALKQSKAAMQEAKADVKTLGSGIKNAGNELKTLGDEYNNAKNKVQSLKAILTSQRTELAQISGSLSKAGFAAGNFGQSEAALKAKIEQTTQAIQRQAQAQRSQAQFDFNNASSNASSAISTAQSIMSPLTGSIEKAMEFEHTMSKVKALTQGENIRSGNLEQVQADMTKLTAQAQELGATTQYTMTQAGEAMGFLGMAGWKTEQIYSAMPGMLDLAAASGSDLARTADIVSDNMTAIGIPAERAGHFMDVYAYAMSNSNVNLENLGETMKYFAPVAKSYGASLEDAAAMTMMLGNAGIKGSMAGTSLRMGLLRLAGPPKTASKEMDALGISLSDATKGALEAQAQLEALGINLDQNATPAEKMRTVLEQLGEKTKNLSQDEKLSAFKNIFGVNAETGWLALFDQGTDTFTKYRDALRNSDGYAKQMAKTMNDDTRGAMIALQSAVDGVQNAIGSAFLNSLRSVIETITPLVSSATQWVQQNQTLVATVGGVAAAVVGLAVGLALFGAMSAGVTAAVATISAAMVALEGVTVASMAASIVAMLPYIAIVAAIAAAAYLIYQNWGTVGPYLTSLWNTISGAVQNAWAIMQPAISQLGAAFDTLFNSIGNSQSLLNVLLGAFAAVGSVIVGVFSTALQVVAGLVSAIVGLFSGLMTIITGFLAGDWRTMWEGAKQLVIGVFNGLYDAAKSLFGGIIDIVGNVVDIGKGIFGGNVGEILKRENARTDWQNGKTGDQAMLRKAPAENTAAINNEVVQNSIAELSNNVLQVMQQNQQQEGGQQFVQLSEQLMTLIKSPEKNSETQQQITQLSQHMMQSIEQAQQEAKAQGNAEAEAAATKSAEQFSQLIQSLQAQQQQQSQSQDNSGAQQNAEAQQQAAQSAQENANAQQQTAQITQQLGEIMNNTNPPVQQLGEMSAGAQGNIQALGEAAGTAAGNVTGMGTAAQQVVNALQSAATAIANIKISAPSVSAAPVAANYMGGIYGKGAFLTTFAERSPEAAIPIDGSQRAIELWQQTGAMLGVYNASTGTLDKPPTPEQQAGEVSNSLKEYQKTAENVSSQTNTNNFVSDKQSQERTSIQRFFDRIIAPAQEAAQNVQTILQYTNTLNAPSTIPNLPTIEQLPFNPLITTQAISGMPLKTLRMPVSGLQTLQTTNLSQTQNETLMRANNAFRNDFISQHLLSMFAPSLSGTLPNQSEGILGDTFNSYKSSQSETSNVAQSTMTPTVNVYVTIEGNADANIMKEAAQQTFSQASVEFERQMANYLHEKERSSY